MSIAITQRAPLPSAEVRKIWHQQRTISRLTKAQNIIRTHLLNVMSLNRYGMSLPTKTTTAEAAYTTAINLTSKLSPRLAHLVQSNTTPSTSVQAEVASFDQRVRKRALLAKLPKFLRRILA